MDLSITIPAFNEAHKIRKDVEAAARFLQANDLSGEIIVVDDGSRDGTAAAARDVEVPRGIDLQVLELPHRGKGWVVRSGMMASHGDYAMFADSGLCVPFEDMLQGMDWVRSGACEIAHGSRKMATSIIDRPQSAYRRALSWAFRRSVLMYLNLPRDLTDTQCGFKLYRGEVARELYSACQTDGFMIDLEVLMRARIKGYSVKEFPVRWSCDRDSRLKPGSVLFRTISELHAVKSLITHEEADKAAALRRDAAMNR